MTDNDSLVSLHTAIVDACHGYDEAISRAKLPDVKAIFERVRNVHEKAHSALHALLSARGLKPDDKGSFMSTVHETVIYVRSAITGLDENSLSAFAMGEDRIVQAYDQAIKRNADDASCVDLLRGQKAALETEIGAMRAVAATKAT